MDQPILDGLIMDPDVVGAEARAILNNTEDHAHLIERTAKSILTAWLLLTHPAHNVGRAGIDSQLFTDYWNENLTPRERVQYRQQARAALAGSELLDRVRELEEQIAAARAELAVTARNHRDAVETIGRADRILRKPRPEPEPIGLKRKP